MKSIVAPLFCFLLASLLTASVGAVPPLITTDTTWHASDSPVLVPADTEVAAGATLTIEPGVTVTFAEGVMLTVRGRLLADGTEAEPVRFTRAAGATTWERILFLDAEDSVLRHCTVEFSNCSGDHKDHYDPDNDTSTPRPVVPYFQAIVAVATHLEIENCLFTNLPSEAGNADGDAIAVISDDPVIPGDASATIRNCRFLGIGQGIHTRYSHVWIEGCFFTDHNGDNDDVDLYGESIPPSYVVNNMFINPDSDDTFNPTRCSAIIIGNVFAGAPDSGVVLRDVGTPVMINNLVYNCRNFGIRLQNECDAWIINNTVVGCGTGIDFFDHSGRHGRPYFLEPGAGRAHLINTVFWDCDRTMHLKNSRFEDPICRVFNCNVEGGQAGVRFDAGSLIWDSSNINADPSFVNLAENDFRLTPASPCVDAGSNMISVTISITNLAGVTTDWTVTVPNDLDGVGRPLDGDNDGSVLADIGAYEFLHPGADSNGDGVPDIWYTQFGLNAANRAVGAENPDGDPHTSAEEWAADTDPTDPSSYLRILSVSKSSQATVEFPSSTNRVYTLLGSTNFTGAPQWEAVAGQTGIPGTGGDQTLSDDSTDRKKLYRIEVRVP